MLASPRTGGIVSTAAVVLLALYISVLLFTCFWILEEAFNGAAYVAG